jgi:hypothetical protein
MSQIVTASPTALNLIPTADLLEPNQARIEYENDGYTGLFTDEAENLYMFQLGITPRLEVGLDFYRFEDDTDTILNAKYVLFTESETHPALAVGAMEIGEGDEASYYAVASKDFGKYRLHLGAAGDDEDTELIAGFETPISESVLFMADYLGGDEGYTAVGAYWEPTKGPAVSLSYGFANESANDDLVMLNLAWTWNLIK